MRQCRQYQRRHSWAWALPGTWDCVRFTAREGTPVLGVPFGFVFLPVVALLVAILVRSGHAV